MNIIYFILILLILKIIYSHCKEYKYASYIIPNLWIGNKISSLDENFLKTNNIGLIINCSKHLPFTNLDNIFKYRLNVNDNLSKETETTILNKMNEINKLINTYLSKNKGVLIHCHAGKQRAPTVTSCYLMSKYNYTLKQIILFIKKKRKIAFTPRINYYNTLLKYSRSI